MRIALANVGDASWIGGLYYVGNLMRALAALPSDEQPAVTLLLARGRDRQLFEEVEEPADVMRFPSLPTRLLRRALRIAGGQRNGNGPSSLLDRTLDRKLDRELARRGASLLFPCPRSMGSQFSVPWVGWTADLQYRHYPAYFPESERCARDRNLARLAAEARIVVVSSRCVARDLLEAFPGCCAAVRVVHFRTVPLPRWFARDAADACARLRLPERFFVVPNQFFIHKNHRTAFKAVRILRDRGTHINLVCTGATEDWRQPDHYRSLTEFIDKHDLADRITILGLLPRDQQIQVLRRAVAVVQPSLFEGWSSVIEDARALGKHVIASDIPVHREQALPSATYFEPNDAEEVAAAMGRVWHDGLPGPCPEDEEEALARQQSLVLRYARRFMEVAADAVGASGACPASPPRWNMSANP